MKLEAIQALPHYYLSKNAADHRNTDRMPQQGSRLGFRGCRSTMRRALANVVVLRDERKATTTGFLLRALRRPRSQGIRVSPVMAGKDQPNVPAALPRPCGFS